MPYPVQPVVVLRFHQARTQAGDIRLVERHIRPMRGEKFLWQRYESEVQILCGSFIEHALSAF